MFGFGLKGSSETGSNVVLKEVRMNGNICGEFIEFSVKQVYENKGAENIDAIYTFPIPDTAVITGFEATLGGRTLKAMVEDDEEAIKINEEAIERGFRTISLEEPEENIFQITIGEIMPSEKVEIKVSYMDVLVYSDNAYKLLVPAILKPMDISEFENENDDYLGENYKISLNLLVESLSKVRFESPSHKISTEYDKNDENLAKVTFVERNARLDKDFELHLIEEKYVESSGMVYDYEENGEEKGILYLRFIPKLESYEEEKPNNYTFLIDTSESMEGTKLQEAKNALQMCIRNLSEGDTFNIVAFDRELHYFSHLGKVPFNEENLSKASVWINNLKVQDGTEIYEAIKYALSEKNQSGCSTILLFTDDIIENEDELLDYVKENIGDNRIFPFGIDAYANSYVLNKLAELGYGKPEFIYEGESIEDNVLRQFNRIENPQVDVLSIDWGNMKVERTYPRTLDYLYDREPFSIFAKVSGSVEGKITLKGKVGEKEYIKTIDLDSLDLKENANLIEKVWARKRIESIEEKRKAERGLVYEAMKNKIVEISKEFGIISSETSFIMMEVIEEPVLGMPINQFIPFTVSESALKDIMDANFLESATFVYSKSKKVIEIDEEGKDGKEILDSKYPRERIFRTLAMYQYADGSFANSNENKLEERIKTTAMSVLAYTLGKEDIYLYINQVNKAIKYLIKTLEENKTVFNNELYSTVAIALKASLEKNALKGNLIEVTEKALEEIRAILLDEHYEKINQIMNYNNKASFKNIVATLFNISQDGKSIEEKIVISEEKDSIYDLAKLGVLQIL